MKANKRSHRLPHNDVLSRKLQAYPGAYGAKVRTVEALIEAIKEALDSVTAVDIRGWFEHCGYPVH
jgi:hypothetical protein